MPTMFLVAVLSGVLDVGSLINDLGSECYDTRCFAQACLESHVLSPKGASCRLELEKATEDHDLEIARRVRQVLDVYYRVSPSDYTVFPWIDMLPADFPHRVTMMSDCLISAGGEYNRGYTPDWPEYRSASGVMALKLMKEGYPRHCVISLLDQMVEAEKDYRVKHYMKDLAQK